MNSQKKEESKVKSEIEKAVVFWRNEIQKMNRNADTSDFKIRKRVLGGMDELCLNGPITIAIVGDSVSHGCFAPPNNHDYSAVYHDRLRRMINERFPTIPVSVLNAAVGGVCAPFALERLDDWVLSRHPDLVIVCFGPNDVNSKVDKFEGAMRGIFNKCRASGTDVIYLTSAMLNTRRTEDTESKYFDYAKKTADMQNGGDMDRLTEAGRKVAAECGVPVADAYAIWRGMQDAGIDTTFLLANRINHPCRELHALFAEVLYKRLFDSEFVKAEDVNEGMIHSAS